jgi:hypothetical protein
MIVVQGQAVLGRGDREGGAEVAQDVVGEEVERAAGTVEDEAAARPFDDVAFRREADSAAVEPDAAAPGSGREQPLR